MDEPFIDSKCPYCSNPVSFPRSSVGSVHDCPNCPEILIVPEEGVEVAAKLPIPIQTPRLFLRKLRDTDSEDLLELMTDVSSFRYIDWKPLDEEGVRDWLVQDKTVRITQPGGMLSLALELVDKQKVIGFLTFYFLEQDHKQAGLTLMINTEYRRQGFGTEAVLAAMALAFEGLGMHRVAVSCDNRNVEACRTLERVGMRREGEFVKSLFQKEEWVNQIWYAMLREEHEAAG